MRTNIVLNDELVAEAMALSGIRTRRELVNSALELFVESRRSARRREAYADRLMEIERRTAGLTFRESARDLVRADRNRR
jgi:Arc/MetJ family transcription regulator